MVSIKFKVVICDSPRQSFFSSTVRVSLLYSFCLIGFPLPLPNIIRTFLSNLRLFLTT